MKYKLLIFDFDGTLGDTRNIIIKAKQETIERMHLSYRDEEACAATIGLSATAGFLFLYPDMEMSMAEECTKMYRALFEEYRKEMPPVVFPHVKETLSKLKEAGVILTVASSRMTASLRSFLENMELSGYMQMVLGSDDTEKLKPDPEPVLVTLQRLGISPEDTLVVGDMGFDILMGRNAGADACGVTFGNSTAVELEKAGAQYIIHDMGELLPIVLG